MIIVYLSIANIISSIFSVIVLTFLYLQYKDRIQGINYWIAAQFVLLLGFLFSILRLVFPEWITIISSHLMNALSIILLYIGFKHYLKKTIHYPSLMLAYLIFSFGLVYFTLKIDDIHGRQIMLYSFDIFFSLLIAYLLVKNTHQETKRSTNFAASVVYFLAILLSISLGMAIINPLQGAYLDGSPQDIYTLIVILVNTVLLTYAQVLLISASLLENVLLSELKFSLIFDYSQHPVFITRASDAKILTVNQSFEDLFGYTQTEFLGKTTLDFKLWEDPQQYVAILNGLKQSNKIKGQEVYFRTKDGRRLICQISSNIIYIQGEQNILNDIIDVSASVALREDLENIATHDQLTGIANRTLFYDRFEQAKAMAERHQHQLAIIMMDMNKLKEINDLYGHLVGDQALMHLTQQINLVLRKSDTFARFGGDEFCLILNEMNDLAGINEAIQRLNEAIAVPMKINQNEYKISVSMGIALYPHNSTSVLELIEQADKAMYAEKTQHGTGVRFYHLEEDAV